tara:strand:+ start:2895 stop:3053 length:159 start_codon:yes stop_codon:yes gene_type:complete
MRSKEEVMLLWIVLGIAALVICIAYPPIILIATILYACISLYKHYQEKNRWL